MYWIRKNNIMAQMQIFAGSEKIKLMQMGKQEKILPKDPID